MKLIRYNLQGRKAEQMENTIKYVPRILFHGTAEQFDTPLRGGGYDNIVWTAENPCIAQNYIMECGIISYMRVPQQYEYDEMVCPNYESIIAVAKAIGISIDGEKDTYGRYKDWRWVYTKSNENVRFTYKALIDGLEQRLGYSLPIHGDQYRLKIRIENGEEVLLPANYKEDGRLHLLTPIEGTDIQIYDHSREGGDLIDPQYNHLNLFEALRRRGYDGVKINDFAQSRRWGNFGHNSIGLFEKGLNKFNQTHISATHFDWSDDCTQKLTPEFVAYANQVNLQIEDLNIK